MLLFQPTRSSKSSSPKTYQNYKQPTAFMFSRPARYGRRAPATSMEPGWPKLPAISRDLPTLATQLFNRSELLHTSNSEHGFVACSKNPATFLIGTFRTSRDVRLESAFGGKAEVRLR